MVLCITIMALAFIGISLFNEGCFLDSCPFAPQISLGIPTTGVDASEVGVSYTKLANLLAKHRFRQADKETAEKILSVAKQELYGKLESADIKKFPCKDMRTINNLWLAHSGGKFGFTVQTKLYEEIYKELSNQPKRLYSYIDSDTFERFARRVGWKSKDKPLVDEELPLNPDGGEGHLPRAYIELGVVHCCRLEGGICLLCPHPLSFADRITQDFFARATSCKL